MLPALTVVLAQPQRALPFPWPLFMMSGLLLLGLFAVAVYFLRKTLAGSNTNSAPSENGAPRVENAPAFMTASMQAVIQKLRDQEKELERLHKAERERAESNARLSEEVTRNMPSALLVIGANGMISAANPAAEQALGIRSLLYRRYNEALGESS